MPCKLLHMCRVINIEGAKLRHLHHFTRECGIIRHNRGLEDLDVLLVVLVEIGDDDVDLLEILGNNQVSAKISINPVNEDELGAQGIGTVLTEEEDVGDFPSGHAESRISSSQFPPSRASSAPYSDEQSLNPG